MTRAAGQAGRSGACAACLRRSWLLEQLSATLDYASRGEGRLSELLALGDEQLLQALAGRRKPELRERYARFDAVWLPQVDAAAAICRHDRRYPAALLDAAGPHMLHLTASIERLQELTARPVVAILGSRRATDYGIEIARSLARGLAASGVTVASGLEDGIAVAAQLGALELDAATVLAMPGGVDVVTPARRRALYEQLKRRGCAVSELPSGTRARRWCAAASERVLAMLAAVTVVVEAEDTRRALAGARLARSLNRTVAAVPGRVTSRVSGGSHALLIDGARLIRDAADVLELLYEQGAPASNTSAATRPQLEPRLQAMLERVGAGMDTPEQLIGEHDDAAEVLLALSELELIGLLTRGDGGRYVPRDALPARPCGSV
jgi:DNA processing protein